ncbi:MAG TPA: hypothetical protein VKE69_14920, partial [Planctomycetota bacterium]|nr:hypothetical protein [Planctomycetota bacterium]
AAETRAALADAMERWDDEAADRAITALVRLVDHDAAFEAMWPLAARSYVNIGHKIIFAAQVERALRRLGWRYAEPVMRSLANGLLYAPGDRETAAFDRSIALASEFPEGWLSKVEDPPRSAEIPKAIRRADPPAAQRAVLASLRDGVGPATAWDGLRLFASELFARRTRSRPADDRRALLPVHAVTVTEAFGYAARTTKVERTQRLLLLQAAAWLAQLRVDLDRIVGLEDEAPKPAPAVADADTLRRAWPGLLARKGVEHHQHKYLAAVIAESRVVHPRWESQILSAALPYAPTADDADTETFARAEHALRAAGIRDG